MSKVKEVLLMATVIIGVTSLFVFGVSRELNRTKAETPVSAEVNTICGHLGNVMITFADGHVVGYSKGGLKTWKPSKTGGELVSTVVPTPPPEEALRAARKAPVVIYTDPCPTEQGVTEPEQKAPAVSL